MKPDTTAVVNAMQYYRTYTGDLSWYEWMLEEGGIEYVRSGEYPWGWRSDRVVDEKKYMLFLLRWS